MHPHHFRNFCPKRLFQLLKSLISLLLFVVPLQSFSGTAGRSFPSLADLDAVVQNSEAYDLPRLHRIDSCRALLDRSEISDRERFFLMEEMRTLYDKYRTDSAIVYASKALSIAEKIGERSLIDRSLAGLAKEFGTSGLYDESLALLDRIDRRAMDEDSLADMFYLYYFDYESLANQCLEPEMAKHFRRLSCMCRDSILLYRPGYTVFQCDRLLAEGNYKAALELVLPVCESLSPGDPAMGPVALSVYDIYSALGMKDKGMDYLVLSAMSDLLNSKKEYIALQELALLLYDEGDLARAQAYLTRSLNDAVFCKARLKVDNIAPLLSLVNESYIKAKRRDSVIVISCLIALFPFVILLLVLVMFLKRQRRLLQKAREEQEKTMALVREASNIKNKYVTQMMLECVTRIERLDDYRLSLNRMALRGETAALNEALKSNAVVEHEWTSFYSVFDKTFLSIFPTFVHDFNELLTPGAKVTPASSQMLTPELRIYALVRLGIDSSERISSLLGYSRSTIYAYRSRTRLKALVPEYFEENIMKIASI